MTIQELISRLELLVRDTIDTWDKDMRVLADYCAAGDPLAGIYATWELAYDYRQNLWVLVSILHDFLGTPSTLTDEEILRRALIAANSSQPVNVEG
jgi:hypothetical protein